MIFIFTKDPQRIKTKCVFDVLFSDRDESHLPSPLRLSSQNCVFVLRNLPEKNFDFNLRIYSQNFPIFKLTAVCYSVDPSVGPLTVVV